MCPSGQLKERLLSLFPSPWSWRATSLGLEERAVGKAYITPSQPARGVAAAAARAVPLGMWLGRTVPCLLGPCCGTLPPPGLQPLSPLLSLHTCLDLLSLSEPGLFVVQNALGQLEEPVQLPLFWAETAAQQFLFPFHLWQSP